MHATDPYMEIKSAWHFHHSTLTMAYLLCAPLHTYVCTVGPRTETG